MNQCPGKKTQSRRRPRWEAREVRLHLVGTPPWVPSLKYSITVWWRFLGRSFWSHLFPRHGVGPFLDVGAPKKNGYQKLETVPTKEDIPGDTQPASVSVRSQGSFQSSIYNLQPEFNSLSLINLLCQTIPPTQLEKNEYLDSFWYDQGGSREVCS